jgi:hypothetical protein
VYLSFWRFMVLDAAFPRLLLVGPAVKKPPDSLLYGRILLALVENDPLIAQTC